MDIDSPFTMVVLIVLIAVGAGVVKPWIETRANSSADAETKLRMEALEREVLRLRDRVKAFANDMGGIGGDRKANNSNARCIERGEIGVAARTTLSARPEIERVIHVDRR